MNGLTQETFSEDDLRLRAPFTAIISGPTSSGKTHFVFRLIQQRRYMIDKPTASVLYCLPPGQVISVPDDIRRDPAVTFHEGIPDFEQFADKNEHNLIILDDLMSTTDSKMMDSFTRHSHHCNISIIFLVQNIFFGGNKFFRTISLNSHYLVCMKNPREKRQIVTLASQIFPENVRFVQEAFADATKEPFTYLLFDCSQKTDDRFRIRTNIFADDQPQNVIYVAQ